MAQSCFDIQSFILDWVVGSPLKIIHSELSRKHLFFPPEKFDTTQYKGLITRVLTEVKHKHSSGERAGGRRVVRFPASLALGSGKWVGEPDVTSRRGV